MAQRSIETVIGRLVTDDEFRETFVRNPEQALRELQERGMHLTAVEMRALTAIESRLWEEVADRIDPRLQKASLKG